MSLPPQLPAELNDDLRDILGLPNFRCSPVAWAFRASGVPIPERAEDEQAFVIWWLLNLYLDHGSGWREKAAEAVQKLKSNAGK